MYVTDDNLEGKVVSMKADKVTLLCDDGFEYEFFIHQVFKVGSDHQVEHKTNVEFNKSEMESEGPPLRSIKLSPQIIIVKPGQVFDLHIEELAPRLVFENAHDTLLFQLNFARNVIFMASQKRVRRVVFVHGIGSGRLREELRRMIANEFPTVEYFDGDYQRFGQGATEINIHQFFN